MSYRPFTLFEFSICNFEMDNFLVKNNLWYVLLKYTFCKTKNPCKILLTKERILAIITYK